MKNISLEFTFKNGLSLKDPFIIASSHLTDSVKAFEFLKPVNPSAITTKTISIRYGGDKFTPKPRRTLKHIKSWNENNIGLYVDGPKVTELWGIGLAHDLLNQAKTILPETKIGLSILQGENYGEIKESLVDLYDFVELNLKYSLRLTEDHKKNLSKIIGEIKSDITNFCETFEDCPKFIKVSREAYSFFTELFISDTLTIIQKYNTAVIIANSKKMDCPPSYARFVKPEILKNGVITGDYLFPETYNIIKEFNKLNQEIEIVANGGIMSIGEILDCMTFGIKSFQICTLLDRKGIYVLEMLRRQLKSCIKYYGCKNIDEFSEYIKNNIDDLGKVSDLFVTKKTLKERINTDGVSFVMESFLDEIDESFFSLNNSETKNYNKNIIFIGSKGSTLSYALSLFLASNGNYRVSLDTSKSILDSNNYSVAIISDAYVKEFRKLKPDFSLQVIGNVRYSLMGVTNDIKSIRKVFLFESAGSEEAKIIIQKQHKFKFEYLKPEELAPLLSGWDENLAILAKNPLTYFYKFLLPSHLQKNWQEVLSIKTPIWLCIENNPELKNKVISDLQKLIRSLSNNIDNTAINLLTFGFNDYMSDLLMEKR
jgi:dihydroorotate dehydrogenase